MVMLIMRLLFPLLFLLQSSAIVAFLQNHVSKNSTELVIKGEPFQINRNLEDSRIVVSSPDGSVSYYPGQQIHINWLYDNGLSSDFVSIYLLKGSILFQVIAQSYPAGYTFFETSLLDSLVEDDDYRIKIIDDGDLSNFGHSKRFAIVPAETNITVIEPSSSTVWFAGHRNFVRWTFSGQNIPFASVFLYCDTSFVQTLVSGAVGSSGYAFTSFVHHASCGSQYRVKVVDSGRNETFAFSSDFGIYLEPSESQITVLQPVEGRSFTHGDSVSIRWYYSTLSSSYVSIYLYKGNSFLQILDSNEDAVQSTLGSYFLSDTIAEGDDYRIMVADSGNPLTFGFSANFSITEPEHVILVSHPLEGTVLAAGTRIFVAWSHSSTTSNFFKIDLYRSSELVESFETSYSENYKYCDLPIGLSPGHNYQFQVTDHNDLSVFGVSVAFEIILADYTIRLSGGPNSTSGQVEISYGGTWGTVCDNSWGLQEASTVCKELGFTSGFPRQSAYFGEGSGTIWLDNVACSGNDTSLIDCSHNGWGDHDCTHSQDAGVTCFDEGVDFYDDFSLSEVSSELWYIPYGSSYAYFSGGSFFAAGDANYAYIRTRSTFQPGSYQITANFNKNEGCDDHFIILSSYSTAHNYFWSATGYIKFFWSCSNKYLYTQTSYTYASCSSYRNYKITIQISGNTIIFSDDGGCTTLQKSDSLLSSEFYVYMGADNEYGTAEWFDIQITSGFEMIPDRVRLVGSTDPHAGRVEVFHNGIWGTVCDDYWDNNDATVVCEWLGISGGGIAYSSAHYGAGSGVIWLDNVYCSGTEESLADCSHNGWGIHNCNHYADAGVRCTGPTPSPTLAPTSLSLSEVSYCSYSGCSGSVTFYGLATSGVLYFLQADAQGDFYSSYETLYIYAAGSYLGYCRYLYCGSSLTTCLSNVDITQYITSSGTLTLSYSATYYVSSSCASPILGATVAVYIEFSLTSLGPTAAPTFAPTFQTLSEESYCSYAGCSESVTFYGLIQSSYVQYLLQVDVQGDFGSSYENLDIYVEGNLLGTYCSYGMSDCSGYMTTCLSNVDVSQYITSSGTLTLVYDTSTDVGSFCTGGGLSVTFAAYVEFVLTVIGTPPTPNPTMLPTSSDAPTLYPSLWPTEIPSLSPTLLPTPGMTDSPTALPTMISTESQTIPISDVVATGLTGYSHCSTTGCSGSVTFTGLLTSTEYALQIDAQGDLDDKSEFIQVSVGGVSIGNFCSRMKQCDSNIGNCLGEINVSQYIDSAGLLSVSYQASDAVDSFCSTSGISSIFAVNLKITLVPTISMVAAQNVKVYEASFTLTIEGTNFDGISNNSTNNLMESSLRSEFASLFGVESKNISLSFSMGRKLSSILQRFLSSLSIEVHISGLPSTKAKAITSTVNSSTIDGSFVTVLNEVGINVTTLAVSSVKLEAVESATLISSPSVQRYSCNSTHIFGMGPYVAVAQDSGEITFGSTCNMEDDTSLVKIKFDHISERDAGGGAVGTTGLVSHTFPDLSPLIFESSPLVRTTFQSLCVEQIEVRSGLDFSHGNTSSTEDVHFGAIFYIFCENGTILIAGNSTVNETVSVEDGSMKFSVFVEDWPFCEGNSASDEFRQCTSSNNQSQFGTYLDVGLTIKTGGMPSLVESPPMHLPPRSIGQATGKFGTGVTYQFSTDTSMVFSQAIKVDGTWTDMGTGYPSYTHIGYNQGVSESMFGLRFPKFSSEAIYDPTVTLSGSSSSSSASPTTAAQTTPSPTSPGVTDIPAQFPITGRPTLHPTLVPTDIPTQFPTQFPTTGRPTLHPTQVPTDGPTTAVPTDSPPTNTPTTHPTWALSDSPTASPPTERPTFLPSLTPTDAPTTATPTGPPPTNIPTTHPTWAPTDTPTVSPPTERPTFLPSLIPTDAPTTAVPTVSPTTARPTSQPTFTPTNAPTTVAPTASPPTNRPTSQPTLTPTAGPTSFPPTGRPTIQQNSAPTVTGTEHSSWSNLTPPPTKEESYSVTIFIGLEGVENGMFTAAESEHSLVNALAGLFLVSEANIILTKSDSRRLFRGQGSSVLKVNQKSIQDSFAVIQVEISSLKEVKTNEISSMILSIPQETLMAVFEESSIFALSIFVYAVSIKNFDAPVFESNGFEGCLGVLLYDSFGDGWSGSEFSLYSSDGSYLQLQSVSLESGSYGEACLEVELDSCYTFRLSKEGSWKEEVSWSLCNANGNADSEVSFCIDAQGNCFLILPDLSTVSPTFQTTPAETFPDLQHEAFSECEAKQGNWTAIFIYGFVAGFGISLIILCCCFRILKNSAWSDQNGFCCTLKNKGKVREENFHEVYAAKPRPLVPQQGYSAKETNVNDGWICPQCNFQNISTSPTCGACGTSNLNEIVVGFNAHGVGTNHYDEKENEDQRIQQ